MSSSGIWSSDALVLLDFFYLLGNWSKMSIKFICYVKWVGDSGSSNFNAVDIIWPLFGYIYDFHVLNTFNLLSWKYFLKWFALLFRGSFSIVFLTLIASSSLCNGSFAWHILLCSLFFISFDLRIPLVSHCLFNSFFCLFDTFWRGAQKLIDFPTFLRNNSDENWHHCDLNAALKPSPHFLVEN